MIQRLHRYILIAMITCSAGTMLHAQERYYQNWNFGPRQGLSFAGDPVAPYGSSISSLEGCSSISDPVTGGLLFYTNGATVWNRNHRVMLNGNDLLGNLSCTQSSLIVPHPGDRTRYFIFTQDGTTIGGPRDPSGYGLRYSVVDMRGDGAMGAVVDKNISLLRTASEKLTAVRHPNGCDFWVITHELGNDKFYAWLVSWDGVHPKPVISETGNRYGGIEAGYLKASPNGKLLFATHSFINYNEASGELFPFDARTGVVGERITYIPAGYGSSFSPDNTFLYSSRADSLYQYDLTVNPTQVVASRVLLNQPSADSMIFGIQLGPDRKIYCLEGPVFSAFNAAHMRINVINKPDLPGTAADYQKLFNYPGVNFFAGLPNCIDGYLGDADMANPGDGVPASISNDTIICAGKTARLEVKGGLWYEWREAEGLDCDTCRVVDVNPLKTTTYSVVVYGLNSCPGLDTLQVTVEVEGYPIEAGPDHIICLGASVQLGVTEGTAYKWVPSDGLSCDDCPDPIATPEKTTTYYVTVEDPSGCAGFDSVTVEVQTDSPVRIEPRDTTIGCGTTLTLRAPGGRDYSWSPSESLSCVDCPEPIASPDKRTTYYLNVVDSTGCAGLDSIVVDISDEEVYAGRDTTLCHGESIQLSARGRQEYNWRPSEGLSCDDCPDPVATPEVTTSYIVEGSTNGVCHSLDTVTITVSEPAEAGEDRALCLGDSVQLQSSPGEEYFWTPARNLTCLYCPDPIAFPITTTTYHVRVKNKDGCYAWDSVTVRVESTGNVTARGDTAFCIGGTAQLSAEDAEGYRWTPSEGLSCEECPDPRVSPTETTTYYVIGSNANGGCLALDSVTVVVHPDVVAEAGTGGAVCEGESLVLGASGGERYEWDASSDLSCLDCPDPVVRPGKSGWYYVTVWNGTDCWSRDSVEVIVHPELSVAAGGGGAICPGDSVSLSAEGGVRWEWRPSEGLSCDDCPNPEASPDATTLYRVRSWNAEGCEGEDSVVVKVRERSGVLRLRIGREYRGGPGDTLEMVVSVDGPREETDVSELELVMGYDSRMMRMDIDSFTDLLSETGLSGWSVEAVEDVRGEVVLRLRAPVGRYLIAGDTLLRFRGEVYLSGQRGTELPLTVVSNSHCYVLESYAGRAEVDSICGLEFRLIELGVEKYVSPTVYPNPTRDRVHFEFGLGLDGETELEVFDGGGRRVGILVREYLGAGRYSVEWDAESVPGGVYWYRLRSGDWVQSGELRIER